MKIPKNLVSIVATCTILAGLTGLVGCKPRNSVEQVPSRTAQEQKSATYFASVPMDYKTGAAAVAGDFDGDGDLDLIVVAKDTGISGSSGRLYLFKNDGKGNFYQDTSEAYGKYGKEMR